MRAYPVVLWAAFLWAVANCVYVYAFRDGVGTYRIESAVIVLVAALLPRAVRGVGRPSMPVELPRQTWTLVGGLIVALWAVIYLPLVTFPLLSDDYVFLDRYRQFSDIARTGQFLRPVFASVFWLLANVFSGSPVPFHLASLALHLASACLVYVLAWRVFRSSGPAMLCFGVFLLNPLQLEAVLWVSGLQELLWTCSVLAALVIYTGAEQLSLARTLLTLLLLAVALLSKETAVCYVLLIPAADAMLFRGRRGARLPLAYGLFAVELVAYLLVRARFVEMEPAYFVEPSRYFLKQFVTLPYRFFVQPWNVTVMQVPLLISGLSAVLAIALLFWTVAIRRTSRGVWIGAFVIVASTAPLYSYFFVREDLAAARYLYFAAAGWAFIVAAFAGVVLPQPRAFAVATAALALALAVSLQLNVRPWRVAADVVRMMRVGVEAGAAPGEKLDEWSARTGLQLTFRDIVPYEYGGVGIFINGYDEFVRIYGRR